MTQAESGPQEAPATQGAADGATASPANSPQPQVAATQARNPLHGIKLEQMVTELSDTYGWAGLAERIPVRCFSHDPSVGSSLKFLRKTPWARDKVEGLYLFMLRDARRKAAAKPAQSEPPTRR